MKVRTSIIAAGAAVVLGTTGTLLVPAMASAHSTTTTLKFISVTKRSVGFTKTTGGQQDSDVNAAGKTVGFDMLYYAAAAANTRSSSRPASSRSVPAASRRRPASPSTCSTRKRSRR